MSRRGRWLIGQHYATGATVILRAIKPALWPGECREAAARWGIGALIGSIVATAAALYLWVFLTLLLIVFIVPVATGIRHAAPTQASTDEHEDDDPEDDEDDEDEADVPQGDELLALLWDLISDERGVHLKTLRKALPGQWSTAEVRELLTEAGIRVRDGVRLPTGNVAGVHRDDVPPLPSPTPNPSRNAVATGQGNNNNGNNTPSGARFTCVDDPDNDRRTTVVWHDQHTASSTR